MEKNDDKRFIRGVYYNQKVTKFQDAISCKRWTKEQSKQTNPLASHLRQHITVFVGWDQLQEFVFPVLERSRRKLQDHVYSEEKSSMRFLLEPRPYRSLSPSSSHQAVLSTFYYLYSLCRAAIFVRISGGQVVLFAPFVNPDYTNDWSHHIQMDGDYYEKKSKHLRWPEDIIEDRSKWWLNGSIICNVMPHSVWGDAYLTQLRDMIDTTCAYHRIPDVEFFINKRDYPLLRKDLTHPYPFVFPPSQRPPPIPSSHKVRRTYTPILSFYGSPRHADILIPPIEDWELATGDVFPPFGQDARSKHVFKPHLVKWKDKKPIAFFRGSATGAGVTIDTNQRLHLASLDYRYVWLDAGITKWNLRDKKHPDLPDISFLDPTSLPFSLKPFVDAKTQLTYKYLIYVQGHCAASRYGTMMLSGSLILKVKSTCEAPDHWLFPYTRAYNIHSDLPLENQDHIEIESNLSNLEEVVLWCMDNDDICQRIVENCKKKAVHLLSIHGVTSYLNDIFLAIHEKTQGGRWSRWFSPSSTAYAIKPCE